MNARPQFLVVVTIGVTAGVLVGATVVGTAAPDQAATKEFGAAQVADGGESVNGTVEVTLTDGKDGDQITIAAAPPADGEPLHVTNVSEPMTIAQANQTKTTIELTESVENDYPLQIEFGQQLNATLASKAVTFHERPTVQVNADETGTGLNGTALVRVSIKAQLSITDFELTDPYGQTGPLEIPFDESGAVTITNVTDQYGNRIYKDESSGSPSKDFNYIIEPKNELTGESEIIEKCGNYSGSGFEIINGSETVPLGGHDLKVNLSDVTTESKLYIYPSNISISLDDRSLRHGNKTSLSIRTEADVENIDVVSVELNDQSNEGNYTLLPEDKTSEFNRDDENEIKHFFGNYGDIDRPTSISDSGKVKFELVESVQGNYTLGIDVMPELKAASDVTTESVSFRVHGPIETGSLSLNRTVLGTVADSGTVTATLEDLRDDAGVLVGQPNATVADVSLDGTSVTNSQTQVQGPAVTIDDIDPTVLPGPTTDPRPMTVAATLDCGTRVQTNTSVSLVHETHRLNKTQTWSPVSIPMAVTDLQYATADGAPAPDAVSVAWNGAAGTYERIDPEASTRPQTWYVAGADRVGVVYDTSGTETTHTYGAGWHHIGPRLDLTRHQTVSLNQSYDRLKAATVYQDRAVVAPDTTASPYETYWVESETELQATTPGGYQPANRSTGPA